MNLHRTRIAPTPSGYLHAGNLYSFLLTIALTRQTKAEVMLRIDDMDAERKNTLFIHDIFETLDFMEINWQAGPRNVIEAEALSQHGRMLQYNSALDVLVSKKLVFACSCTRSDIARQSDTGIYPGTCLHKGLDLNQKGVAWRIDTRNFQQIKMQALSGAFHHVQLPDVMQYFVVRRKEGYPAYQVTSVVDDVFFGVDMIVRGADLQSSSIAQLFLAQALDMHAFSQAKFYHHVLLKNPNGSKLSKSAGDLSIQAMRKRGLSRMDILQYIHASLPEPQAKEFADHYL